MKKIFLSLVVLFFVVNAKSQTFSILFPAGTSSTSPWPVYGYQDTVNGIIKISGWPYSGNITVNTFNISNGNYPCGSSSPATSNIIKVTIAATNNFGYNLCIASGPLPDLIRVEIRNSIGTVLGNVYFLVIGTGVSGNIYSDANNNCVKNAGETDLSGVQVKLYNATNTYWGTTNSAGMYNMSGVTPGIYTVQAIPPFTHSITCSGSMTQTVSVISNTMATRNFAMYAPPVPPCSGFDIGTYWTGLYNGFFPGAIDAVNPLVGSFLNCGVTSPGQVKVVLDPCLTYTSTCPFGNTHNPPSTVIPGPSGDTLIWNVSNINMIGNSYYHHVKVCTTAVVGQTACVTTIVLPSTGDVNPSNNTYTQCFNIGVSYDPNYKEVSPKGFGATGNIPPTNPFLDYTIHFQNTGTAPARHVFLLDSLPSQVDISNYNKISNSHTVTTTYLGNRVFRHDYYNINLPDSATDPEGSSGYVTFRVGMQSGLALGTQIKNRAYIYFDYNAPVITNYALNTISLATSITEFGAKGESGVYPNPTNGTVMINNKDGYQRAELFDISGRQLLIKGLNSEKEILDLSTYNNGIYLLRLISSEGQMQNIKIIKN
jgi:uncharacterized repeat protein (TIGR01451 family)